MNPLDLACLIILVILGLWGVWTGLVKSIFRLAAVAAGVAGAWLFGDTATTLLSGNLDSLPPFLLSPLSKFVTFLLFWMTVTLIGSIARKWVHKSPLGPLDRAGGGILGIAKGLVLCILLLALLSALPAKGRLAVIEKESMALALYIRAVGLLL